MHTISSVIYDFCCIYFRNSIKKMKFVKCKQIKLIQALKITKFIQIWQDL